MYVSLPHADVAKVLGRQKCKPNLPEPKKKEKHKKCNYDSSGRSGQRQQNEPQMCKAGNKKWLKYAAAIFIPAKVLRAYAA